MKDPFDRPTLCVGIFYRDPLSALAWLERAFGFRRSMVIADRDGQLVHAEMRFHESCFIVDGEWCDDIASPLSKERRNTQACYVRLSTGLDQHCAVARGAGAEIVQEPEDQSYGDRTYRARDPEGHLWTFFQPVHVISREQLETLTGWSIDGWHPH
ncbi:VOC family protein [Rhizorhabdus phycosphaerae]|uniref:VOC family protein n=1 Tax=Rhizorhabdus phycosphaerae TaxID=2711156 RepID=UPI0013EACE1C|nr:VOC family protein [Rhizorhabdus phycosphaerae]